MEKLAQLDFSLLCLGHAFLGGTLVNEPNRVGPEGKAFLRGGIQVADTIQAACAAAVRKMPGAKKGEIAHAAMAELIYDLPLQPARDPGIPRSMPPTLLGHINAALSGSYPA